jgi:hypothetical protein
VKGEWLLQCLAPGKRMDGKMLIGCKQRRVADAKTFFIPVKNIFLSWKTIPFLVHLHLNAEK